MVNFLIVDTEHCPGHIMGDIDGLSRFRLTSFDSSLHLHHLISDYIIALLKLCDPTVSPSNLHSYASLLSLILSNLSNL